LLDRLIEQLKQLTQIISKEELNFCKSSLKMDFSLALERQENRLEEAANNVKC